METTQNTLKPVSCVALTILVPLRRLELREVFWDVYNFVISLRFGW